MITEQPKLIGRIQNEGETIVIRGCQIVSYFNLTNSDVYWLKNGLEKVALENVTITGRNRRSEYLLSDLQFERSNYVNQGFYQCAVFSRSFMKTPILSEKIHIQFEGQFLHLIFHRKWE